MSHYERISEKLMSKREILLSRIDKINLDYSSPLNRDSSEQAIELENAEVLSGIHKGALEELNQIDRTLELIEKDEYGTCRMCGMPIPVKRLEAIPYTCYCVTCAGKR
ncbi:MAG: TraR/DksA C4-type zinc finger protein [Deltaproteobacteria bacterium]|nr:TraR/DksA C4-type zinc finger protein [Deltaproteobacteria bacterium]